MKNLLSAILLTLILSACSESPENAEQKQAAKDDTVKPENNKTEVNSWEQKQLLGSWYGEEQDADKKIQWLVVRFDDNKYEVSFKITEQEAVKIYREKGIWSLEDNQYQTQTQFVFSDGETKEVAQDKPYYRNSYKIVALDDKEFSYQDTETKRNFLVKKVAKDFSF